jgi:uncharacterized membrane protein (TIGR02234 family)
MRVRSKLALILGIALASAAALLAASQAWVHLELIPGSAAFGSLSITGQQLNASLTAIALAGFAAALALTIAGPGFRRVLGVLVVLFGAGIAAVAISVLADPWGSAAGRLAEATGIAGEAQLDMVERSAITPFIAVAIVCGALLALLGVLVLVFGGGWKKSAGRKYAAREERAGARAEEGEDRFADWDSLSEGGDPTASDQSS